jgi:hypothetical protein
MRAVSPQKRENWRLIPAVLASTARETDTPEGREYQAGRILIFSARLMQPRRFGYTGCSRAVEGSKDQKSREKAAEVPWIYRGIEPLEQRVGAPVIAISKRASRWRWVIVKLQAALEAAWPT